MRAAQYLCMRYQQPVHYRISTAKFCAVSTGKTLLLHFLATPSRKDVKTYYSTVWDDQIYSMLLNQPPRLTTQLLVNLLSLARAIDQRLHNSPYGHSAWLLPVRGACALLAITNLLLVNCPQFVGLPTVDGWNHFLGPF